MYSSPSVAPLQSESIRYWFTVVILDSINDINDIYHARTVFYISFHDSYQFGNSTYYQFNTIIIKGRKFQQGSENNLIIFPSRIQLLTTIPIKCQCQQIKIEYVSHTYLFQQGRPLFN